MPADRIATLFRSSTLNAAAPPLGLFGMKLRAYVAHDAAATMSVFERAIRITASTDYTSEQIDAWASTGLDSSDALAWWAPARAAAVTIVAVEDEQVVGFSDLVDGSLLDMLFVDPDVSRRGVGAALVTRIVRLARAGGAGTPKTYASLTARPLFERFGFVIVERCTRCSRGRDDEFQDASRPLSRDPARCLLRGSCCHLVVLRSNSSTDVWLLLARRATPALIDGTRTGSRVAPTAAARWRFGSLAVSMRPPVFDRSSRLLDRGAGFWSGGPSAC